MASSLRKNQIGTRVSHSKAKQFTKLTSWASLVMMGMKNMFKCIGNLSTCIWTETSLWYDGCHEAANCSSPPIDIWINIIKLQKRIKEKQKKKHTPYTEK